MYIHVFMCVRLSLSSLTLLALRSMPDILSTFTMQAPQQMQIFEVFSVMFIHPCSLNLFEYAQVFTLISRY